MGKLTKVPTVLLRHALQINASEDGAFDSLIVAQITLDSVAQKMRAAHSLLTHCDIDLFKHALWQIE